MSRPQSPPDLPSSRAATGHAQSAPLPSSWFGELELWFASRGEKTALMRQRHVGPLVVQRPFHPEADGTCHVYLLHPPGGIAGGDRLETKIHLGPGTSTLLTTPGATKFYRSTHGRGEQSMSISIGEGAVCEHLPQETILFDGADASIDIRVFLASGATYVGWDFLSLGRPAADEAFKSGRISQRIEVVCDAGPIWFERLHLTGGSPLSQASYALADQPILGTMIYVGDAAEDCAERVRGALKERAADVFSVSQLKRVVVCRYLGQRVSEAKSLFASAWDVLRTACLGKPANAPRIWAT
ncbi:urease accessory protein UreD [Rhizobium sp. R693]|uniref:urease accessory protein UreD n=1 Tax=Rhizobium sp. R693 TaxID=1764276 RepID=UPI000B538042|nr:urease accessory protein UreD [Rhizobium sp. R693]